jgi:hypothetical protein
LFPSAQSTTQRSQPVFDQMRLGRFPIDEESDIANEVATVH